MFEPSDRLAPGEEGGEVMLDPISHIAEGKKSDGLLGIS